MSSTSGYVEEKLFQELDPRLFDVSSTRMVQFCCEKIENRSQISCITEKGGRGEGVLDLDTHTLSSCI